MCSVGLGTCNLSPSPMSLLGKKVTKPLSLVTSIRRTVEAEKASGWTHGLREAVSRPAGLGLATKTNLHCYLPLWEGGIEPEALLSSHQAREAVTNA